MSSDNYIRIENLIETLQDYAYQNLFVKSLDEGEMTLMWKNPRTGRFVYVGQLDAFGRNGIIGGLTQAPIGDILEEQ